MEVRELLEELILGKKRKLSLYTLPLILETRSVGLINKRLMSNEIESDEELYRIIRYLSSLNKIRNEAILSRAVTIDNLLKRLGIARLWLKGIAEIHQQSSCIENRKVTDVDLLTNQTEEVRDHLIMLGLKHGVYSREGEWKEASEEKIKIHEKEHYELYPLTKIIPLDIPAPILYPNLMKRYRVFYNQTSGGFYTDLVIDIHHSLNIDFPSNWLLENENKDDDFPILSEIDSVWYLSFKCYYELLKGKSTDLQLLFSTIDKIRNTSFSVDEVGKRMDDNTNYFDQEVLDFMNKLANKDPESIDELLNCLTPKVQKKIKENNNYGEMGNYI